MPNHYNNYTTNNFNVKGGGVSTQLVHYDKPLFVVLGGDIYEMFAMMIVVSVFRDQEGRERVNTYRIPLTGKDLEPWEARSLDDTLFTLPEDKRIDANTLRKYLDWVEDESEVDSAICTLKNKEFVPVVEEQEIQVKVYKVNDGQSKGATLNSPWFYLRLKRAGENWFRPSDVLGLCAIRQYLNKPFKFVPADPEYEEDIELVENLDYLMAAFDKHGFYVADGKDVENDGTYAYSKDIGKIPMTREEFIEKFSDNIYPMMD